MKKTLKTHINLQSIILCLVFFVGAISSQAATGNWVSITTGGNIVYTVTNPSTAVKDVSGNFLTVVYLENLSFSKIGQNTNATDVNWLLSKGYRVIELDYTNNVKATAPGINADIIAINTAINSGSFCGLSNCSKYRSYVLFEGYRIARDVSYFKDDPTIYNYPSTYTVGDSLYMDIIYPANPSAPVPVVLSFSYSNSSGDSQATKHQRLNLGNTLAGFNDSFLEGAPANGIAWAIADHPKYCNWGQGKPVGGANKTYASYEVNPDAAQKVKSAIRTLRATGINLGLSGKIGIYGFSRGSTAGSMAIGDRSVANFENAGLNIGVSDDVQVAALGSGVFDYTQIYNTAESDIGNLTTNCPLAWGALASNQPLWESQGAAYLAETSATAPVIFFYNTTDASYYQHQISTFKTKLTELGVPTASVVDYGTGHAVPQTSTPLSVMYNFFKQYLTPPSVTTQLDNSISDSEANLTVFQNSDELNISFVISKPCKALVELSDLSGKTLYKNEKLYSAAGKQSEIINTNSLHLSQGIYLIKISTDNCRDLKKFIKN